MFHTIKLVNLLLFLYLSLSLFRHLLTLHIVAHLTHLFSLFFFRMFFFFFRKQILSPSPPRMKYSWPAIPGEWEQQSEPQEWMLSKVPGLWKKGRGGGGEGVGGK